MAGCAPGRKGSPPGLCWPRLLGRVHGDARQVCGAVPAEVQGGHPEGARVSGQGDPGVPRPAQEAQGRGQL